MKKRYVISVLAVLTVTTGLGQGARRYIAAAYGSGFLVAHRSSMRHLIQGHSSTFELSYLSEPIGVSHLSTNYTKPVNGLSFLYLNTGNPKQIGHCFGLYPNIRFKLGLGKFAPRLKFGGGIGYVQKPFDQVTNNKNVTIGTHINSIINVAIEGEISIKLQFIKYGIAITHFSNASFNSPNLGINIPTVYVGFAVGNPANEELEIPNHSNYTNDKSLFIRAHEVFLFGGARQVSLHHPKKYLVGSLGFQYLHQFSPKFAWCSGIDVFANPSLLAATESGSNPNLMSLQIGGFGGLELKFNDNSVFLQQGVYLFSEYKENGPLYQKIGYRKRFAKTGIVASLGIKTHFGIAEYIELGIGYRFIQNTKKNKNGKQDESM
ncbi:MAG: acyloxyacyl hydrolase [Flavobacteriales bacterium]|nr:acyloxyacyl hydrolase [Flavobacteriales bacterium]